MGKVFNFDIVPDRRNSNSYKWDSDNDPDLIPLWVADMDFETAPVVKEALRRRVEHGVFGYVKVPDSYYSSIRNWFASRHGWDILPESVIYTSGVIPALSAIIKALCSPGEGVMIQTPAYNHFFTSIRNNGCRVVENPLLRHDTPGGFTYSIDFDDLERKAADPSTTMMILCNPHNPTGRIWTREELTRMRDICKRNGVKVVSDEIHNELTLPGRLYLPYAEVDPEAIVCISPSKAFNIAGLQIANIVVPVEDERKRVDRAININEVCDVNPFGVVALQAAYNEGPEWLDALRDYIGENYRMLREFFRSELPSLPVADLEATYLAWVDIRSLGVDSETFETRGKERFGVWVNAGAMYGLEGYIRINMACPRERLLEGLRRVKSCAESFSNK